jgi:hypothetical protein
VQPEPPELAAVAGAPAVIGVRQGGASVRFAAFAGFRARHRGAVDEQQIVLHASALVGEDAQQLLERVGEAATTTLEVTWLLRQL